MTDLSSLPLAEAVYAAYALALSQRNTDVADPLLRALELLAAQSGDSSHLNAAYTLIERSIAATHNLRPHERSTH